LGYSLKRFTRISRINPGEGSVRLGVLSFWILRQKLQARKELLDLDTILAGRFSERSVLDSILFMPPPHLLQCRRHGLTLLA
jgi:hypothetical protein